MKNKKEDVKKAILALENNGIIAFPTDTVYGLACVYDSEEAINKIKQAKGRDEKKPLPMMLYSVDQIEKVAYVNETTKKIINKFMPGALTIVLKKREEVPSYVTNGFDTIGIRIPNHELSLEILRKINKPLLVTSANKSDTSSKFNSEEVRNDIGEYLDYLIDGESDNKLASTIVSLINEPVILREGTITLEEILKEIN